MHKIKIIDSHSEKIFEKDIKNKKKKDEIIKIDDSLFEIGLRKGLIEKNEDGYYFIGDYEELLAFKSKRLDRSFNWLD